jgi:hypothetical protein
MDRKEEDRLEDEERDDPPEPTGDERTAEHEGRDGGGENQESPAEPEPEPKPGVTAPLDHLTEEEEAMEPAGLMPGAGPDGGHDSGEGQPERRNEDEPEPR